MLHSELVGGSLRLIKILSTDKFLSKSFEQAGPLAADRETIEVLSKYFCQYHFQCDLAHNVDLDSVFALL